MTSATANAHETFDVQDTAGFTVSDGDEDVDEFDHGDDETDAQGLYIEHKLLNFDNLEEDEDDTGVPSQDPLYNDNDDNSAHVSVPSSLAGEDQSSDDDDEIIVPPSKYFIEELQLQKTSTSEPTCKAAKKSVGESMEVMVENSITISSVTSLSETEIPPIERNRGNPKPAVFSDLDVYRCFICRRDFPCHDHFMNHRTKKHSSVVYDSEIEKPFACGICGRPWNQPRKALACAVFGHDPSKLQAAMFCHSCPMCPEDAFGFHSLPAVANHWMSSHPEKLVPLFLSKLRKGDDFLPKIKVTAAEMREVSEAMLKSHNDPMKPLVLDTELPLNYDLPTELNNVESTVKDEPKLKRSRKQTFPAFNCRLCETSIDSQDDVYKHRCIESNQNLRKHMPVHVDKLRTTTKKSSEYKCNFCGKEYYISNSLIGHRLKSSTCKHLYAKYRGMKKNNERWDTVLKSNELVDMNLTTEMQMASIPLNLARLESSVMDSETESSPLNVQFQSDVEIGEEMTVIIKEEEQLSEVLSECDSTDQNYTDDFRGNRIKKEPNFGELHSGPWYDQKYTGDKVSEATLGEIASLNYFYAKPMEQDYTLRLNTNNSDGQINLDPHEDHTKRSLRSNANLDSGSSNIDLKSHACNICSKTFQNICNLKRHIIEIHENRTLHICNVCQKSFTNSWNWKRHMKYHSKKSSNQCTVSVSEPLSKDDEGKTDFDGQLEDEHQNAHEARNPPSKLFERDSYSAKPISDATATSSKRLKYSSPKHESRNSSRIAQSTATDHRTIASQRAININDKSALKKLFGNRRLRILVIKNEVYNQRRTTSQYSQASK